MADNVEEGRSLRFEIGPTPGESLRACQAIAQAALPPSRADQVVIAVYAAVILAAWFVTPSTRAQTVGIGVGAALATSLALRAEGQRRVKLLQDNDPHARETYYVELDAHGVHTWCGHVDARYPWSDFSKVIENAEFILFVRASGSGAAIPKRLLDPPHSAALRASIQEWAPALGSTLPRVAS